MNIVMFIVGAVIFTVYVGFLMWNIFYNHNKNREENYPGYYTRHKQPDDIEVMTGHYPHNYKAISKRISANKLKRNVKRKEKTSNSYRSS